MNVRSGKYVDAVQLVFMKLKPDGTLDPKDAYTGPWLGPDSDGKGKIIHLAGDGRPVIGIDCRHGAILDGIALVQDVPAAPATK